jgi:hypothetical protein
VKKEEALEIIEASRNTVKELHARSNESYFAARIVEKEYDAFLFVIGVMECKVKDVDEGDEVSEALQKKLSELKSNIQSVLRHEKLVNQMEAVHEKEKLEVSEQIEVARRELSDLRYMVFYSDGANRMWIGRIEACEAHIEEVAKEVAKHGELKETAKMKLRSAHKTIEQDLKPKDSKFRELLFRMGGRGH